MKLDERVGSRVKGAPPILVQPPLVAARDPDAHQGYNLTADDAVEAVHLGAGRRAASRTVVPQIGLREEARPRC